MLPHRGPHRSVLAETVFHEDEVWSVGRAPVLYRRLRRWADRDLISGKPQWVVSRARVSQSTEPQDDILERFANWRGAPVALCVALFVVAFALRLGLAIAHPSIFRPDEVFQSLEPAHGLLGGRHIAAWEWLEGARSWVFPYIIVGPMALARVIGLAAPGQIAAAWALCAAVGASTVVAAFVLGFRYHGLLGAALCGVVCATWPDLVYFGPKTLTEILGGHLLVLAVCLAAVPPRLGDARTDPGWWRCVAVGLLLGLCFCIRFHLAPGIIVTALWFGRLNIQRRWIPMIIGAAVPLLATAAIDWVTWGVPFFPIWKSLQTQLFQRAALQLGDHLPWTYYLTQLVWEWGAAVPFLAIPFVLAARRYWPLVLTAAAIVLSHMVISYKELNYVYAAMEISLIVAALGTADIVIRLTAATGGRLQRRVIGRQAIWLWLAIAASVSGSASFARYWQDGQEAIAAATMLRKSPDLCGLGIFDMLWQHTAGYAWMNTDAPTYAVATIDGLNRASPAFNYLIVPARLRTIGLPEFAVLQCGSELCLMRRAGDCTEIAGLQNNLLAGQLKP